MNFFEQQDQARRRTGRLVFYFILAVVAIIVALYFVVLLALALTTKPPQPGEPNPYVESPWHPDLLGMVALATIVVVVLSSLYKTSQLSAGGETVALLLGGRLINQQTAKFEERRLLNVVEEMAVASGVPVPPIYVMDNEPSINAFAAGFAPGDAVIGVSRGCLDYLNRDEMQGVMAHEFSHILNGDMRMNLRLVGVLFGILVMAILGWYLLRGAAYSGRSRSKEGGGGAAAILIIGIGLMVLGGIGLFFGKLIKSALSRQREYLADASAVQFTRNPDGIGGALKKIGGRPETSKIEDAHAEEVSHMFFGSAFGSFSSRLFATHPPLVERIQRIDPQFDGEFPTVKKLSKKQAKAEAAKKAKRKPLRPLGTGPGGAIPIDPTGVLDKVGLPGAAQLAFAAALLEDLPDPIREAAREPYGARAVVYTVLLDRDAEVRKNQLAALRERAEELSYRETERLIPLVDQLPDEARIPVVELTFPALRELSPSQYSTFRDNVQALVDADG
ncbi:MAG: M48 family metallopeptidase, partial [Planctomycetota bacterium]